jgi:predicted dehydrogenase
MNVNAARRVAVVGPGGWGRQHARIFGSRPDTELVAIVGRGSERVQAQAQAARTAGFTDIGAMLDAVQPDLVSVCAPQGKLRNAWVASTVGRTVTRRG